MFATLPGRVVRDFALHRWVTRILLVAAFAAGAHLYDWWWLRVLTTETLVKISALLSVPMVWLGADTVFIAGVPAKFVVSCTMIDVFAGAIPLLWRTDKRWSANLLRLGAAFGGVFALNIVRLEAGFAAMTGGVPWWLAHECVAGVTYFVVLQFLMKQRAWDAMHPPHALA